MAVIPNLPSIGSGGLNKVSTGLFMSSFHYLASHFKLLKHCIERHTPLCTAPRRIGSMNSFVKENIMSNHTSIMNLFNSKGKTLTFDQPQGHLQPLLFIEFILRIFNDSTHGSFQDIYNDILAMLPGIGQVVNYVTMNQLHFFNPRLGRCRVAAKSTHVKIEI